MRLTCGAGREPDPGVGNWRDHSKELFVERTDERLRCDQPNGAFRSAEAQRDRRCDGRHSKRCSVRHVAGASYYEADPVSEPAIT